MTHIKCYHLCCEHIDIKAFSDQSNTEQKLSAKSCYVLNEGNKMFLIDLYRSITMSKLYLRPDCGEDLLCY